MNFRPAAVSNAAGFFTNDTCFYLLTFAFSLPTLIMKAPLHDPAFVLGAGDDTGVVWAALFDFLTGLTGIGTAVALYPVARRVSRTRSLGFVTSRVVEAGILVVGALAILAMVTLHQDFAGASGDVAASVQATGQSLLAIHGADRGRAARRGLILCGALCLVGTVGPILGDLRLQRIGVVGYALGLPGAAWLLLRWFAGAGTLPAGGERGVAADQTAHARDVSLYLRECAGTGRRLAMQWRTAKSGAA